MATYRTISVAATLSIIAHITVIAALRAPQSQSEQMDALPDLHLSIEQPADLAVEHKEVGEVLQTAAPTSPRRVAADKSRDHLLAAAVAAPSPNAPVPPVEVSLTDARDWAVSGPPVTIEVVATIGDGVRAMPVTERKMIAGRIQEWWPSLEGAEPLATQVTWEERGRLYRVELQRMPTASDMDVERVIVEVTTEEDGQLFKSRMRVKRLAFSHFTQLVDRWDPEVQLHDDEIIGRFHSNSALIVGWDRKTAPRFLGQVTMAARKVVIANAASARARSDIFRGGLETGVRRISLSKVDRPIAGERPVATARTVSLERDSSIVFYADGSVGWRAIESGEPEQRIAGNAAPLYLLGAPKVTIFVRGAVRGAVLVHSLEDIVINGSITCAREPPGQGSTSGYLGLAADRDVVVAGPDATGPGDLQIDAAIYARRRFLVRDLDQRRQATLHIFGSLSAGTVSATEPRYATRVEYDPRFERMRPPGFPMTGRYELEDWDGQWEPAYRE